MWSIWVHWRLEEGERQVTYRRLECLRFLLAKAVGDLNTGSLTCFVNGVARNEKYVSLEDSRLNLALISAKIEMSPLVREGSFGSCVQFVFVILPQYFRSIRRDESLNMERSILYKHDFLF